MYRLFDVEWEERLIKCCELERCASRKKGWNRRWFRRWLSSGMFRRVVWRSPWWWRQQASLKRRSVSTRLHDATSQNIAIFILVAVRTRNLITGNLSDTCCEFSKVFLLLCLRWHPYCSLSWLHVFSQTIFLRYISVCLILPWGLQLKAGVLPSAILSGDQPVVYFSQLYYHYI
jgi:hypothetical protein